MVLILVDEGVKIIDIDIVYTPMKSTGAVARYLKCSHGIKRSNNTIGKKI